MNSILDYEYFIGIDAGATGAIFVLNKRGEPLGVVRPTLRKLWGRMVFDPEILRDDIAKIIRRKDSWHKVFVLIEQVNSRKQGSAGAFTFSANSLGMIICLETLGATVKSIASTEWKGKMKCGSADLGVRGKTEAEQSRLLKTLAAKRAKEIFPDFKFGQSRKKDEQEAALIARVGWNSIKVMQQEKRGSKK